MTFEQMLELHKNLVNENMETIINDLVTRMQEHDMDKINDPEIYAIYKEHFPALKTIAYGTPEYFAYEKNHFEVAHQKHAQNDHHFYSHRNNTTKPNLLDLIEAIVDIYSSNLQYSKEANHAMVLETIKNKGIYNVPIEEFISNTLSLLEGENNETN